MKKFITITLTIAVTLSIFAIFSHKSTANTVVRVPTIPTHPIIVLRESVVEFG
jgi:hypothetical protein